MIQLHPPLSHLLYQDCFEPLLLRQKKDGLPGSVVFDETSGEERKDDDPQILCKVCNLPITAPKFSIAVDSHHSHTFFNPAGIVFEIGCFSKAPGCGITGGPSREFSWFSGTAWSTVACNSCLVHLGWLFEGRESPFFGLILNRLIETK